MTWVYEKGSYVPCGKIVNGKHYSILSDYIGRPIQACSEEGKLVWSTDYDIYGKLRNLVGDRMFIPFRQLGQYEDIELGGLYYNRFRYYDSNSGLYIAKDPIGLAGNNPTFYAYVWDSNGQVDVFGLASLNLSKEVKKLFLAGKYREAMDFHYEDLIKNKTGGVSRILEGREYDAITEKKIIQAKRSMSAVNKPKNFLTKSTRTQIKKTIDLANRSDKIPEFWFKYGLHPNVKAYIEGKGGNVVEGLGENIKKYK